MPLVPGQIQVHYAFTDRFADVGQLEAFAALLSDEERARRERFRFERDRHLYLVAHALVRDRLSALTGLPPRALQFESGEHGKPELVSPGAATGVRFNLSHTHGLVACAVGLHDDLGVDVEHRDRTVELEQVARSVYSPAELEGLLALEGRARRVRFFQLWTLKEAYIKAVGQGLSMPLKQITLSVGGPEISLDLSQSDLGDGADWCLTLAEPGADHQLAVAVRSRSAGPPQLREGTGEVS